MASPTLRLLSILTARPFSSFLQNLANQYLRLANKFDTERIIAKQMQMLGRKYFDWKCVCRLDWEQGDIWRPERISVWAWDRLVQTIYLVVLLLGPTVKHYMSSLEKITQLLISSLFFLINFLKCRHLYMYFTKSAT